MYSRFSTASCSGVKTPVAVAGRISVNQAGSSRAASSIVLAWFDPRGVVMKSAQPLFSARIGRRNPQAAGSASAHSEKTTPAGGEPTSELKLSDPTMCSAEPDLKRIIISFSRVVSRSACGNASSMRRRPLCGLTASQIARRPCAASGSMCQ
jgi:hypothetical protein